jgi:cardiolipin synthase
LRHLPNLLSALRFLLAPLIALHLANGRYREALVWLIAAIATDAADGAIARRFGWSSAAGALLDPVADKVLLVSAFGALGYRGVVPLWFVAVVLARDLLILLFSAWALAFTSVRSLPPTLWGKLSTVLQSAYVSLATLVAAGHGVSVEFLLGTLLWAAMAGTAGSAVHYAYVGLRRVRQSV